MKVLLWKSIEKLGNLGQVVEVKPGYARNYLFPQRLATPDTPRQHQALSIARRKQELLERKMAESAQALAAALEKFSVSLEVNTTEDGTLYGSVTPTMIADALREQGARVEPKAIQIDDPIKQVGYYEVLVNLHRDVKPKLKVWVVSANPEPGKVPAQKPEAPPAAP
jgi:large subunit ribosomal protein L9